ncbi:Uncharacterised protein [Mycobacteroides abscessus subsp. abscessus]|nr:Uncharacterised protein [Mycobacteroides abscessus subsp. abscessus]SLK64324.1 Uncharacterised protein [Mycobacteroides abscessus subsp. abscessus]
MIGNVIRTVGEPVKEKTIVIQGYEAEIVARSAVEYVLIVGDGEVADASESSRGWIVNVRGPYTNGFYVTDRDEAVDALEDLAHLILAARKGAL